MKKIHVVLFLFILTACIGQEPSRENWLKNSANEVIYVQVEGYEHRRNKKIAFIQHGLASNLEHSAVQTAKKAFLDNGYLVIIFDSRYSMGKSDGEVINVRLATFKKDLETVINWAKKQNFYREPFILAGHSLGGASVLQYSAENASVIDAVIPITPVVSGVTWENSILLQFFELPMPSFIKSQFMASIRASPGWHPLHDCQFWKQCAASLKYFSPRCILFSVRFFTMATD